jgi:hypothetical protein
MGNGQQATAPLTAEEAEALVESENLLRQARERLRDTSLDGLKGQMEKVEADLTALSETILTPQEEVERRRASGAYKF